jgi:hypothetical protein
VRDEIRRYLDEHGGTYTADALRSGLLSAGYEAGEVDAALSEWASERGRSPTDDRRSFGRWSLLIDAATLAVVFGVTVLLIGTEVGLAVIGVVVLLVFLLVAWAISALLGRFILPRMGLSVALVIPLVLALGLGGTCLALMDGMTPTRPMSGTVDLRIGPPMSFSGSGAARCFVQPGSQASSISADNLGTLDGRTVSLTIDNFTVTTGPGTSAEQAAGPDAPIVSIMFSPESETEPGFGYSTIVSTRMALQNAADARSGTIRFEGLAPEPGGEPGVLPTGPISGTISWTCEVRR